MDSERQQMDGTPAQGYMRVIAYSGQSGAVFGTLRAGWAPRAIGVEKGHERRIVSMCDGFNGVGAKEKICGRLSFPFTFFFLTFLLWSTFLSYRYTPNQAHTSGDGAVRPTQA